ncbi:MAG: M28 family peptidase [Gemmatimonadaceae bacterium]
MTTAARARDHLAVLAARSRRAGSVAEAAARAHCARVLRSSGFEVREEPFEYSAAPGRYATSAGGIGSTLLLVAATVLAARGRPGAALAILVAGGALLGAAALWLARVGVLRAPLMRRRGVNLIATRGVRDPPVWLVAHLDSKSQPVPILLRAGAIVLHGVTWAAALVLCAAQWFGASLAEAWPSVGALGFATGLPVVASVVGDRSAGAVDNASGVAAVLLAAAALPRGGPTGVLITSAEELGLAGARAWVRTRGPAIALNCDGIDDEGDLLCMYSGRRPTRLVQLFERAAERERRVLRIRRLLPGVLVDGVAFADAGWEALTLSRGTAGTLARIHTKRDSLELLSGAGVDDAVPILTRVARELC